MGRSSNGYDPTVLFITGEELRITAKRDIGRSWYVATGVSRPNYDDLERSRDHAMKVTDFVSWTTQMPLDLDASNAAYDVLVGRVSEFLLQRDEEALGQQGVSQIVGAWRRFSMHVRQFSRKMLQSWSLPALLTDQSVKPTSRY